MNENESKGQFLTFGSGKRSCFGRKLALLEIKYMIYYLLKVKVITNYVQIVMVFTNSFSNLKKK